MPMSIRPIGDPKNSYGNPESNILMDVDALAAAISFDGTVRTSSKTVVAEATDEDAKILLDLFNNGTIVSEAESVEDKKYAVPKDFSNDSLMRLKSASLVYGDSNVINFTSKAARVIKTLVLAEQNAYAKTSVKKPYSVILAENKAKASNRSTLAFERTASVIEKFAQANREIPPEHMPTRDHPYLSSSRIFKREGTSDKQYIVRVFDVHGRYVVIAWNGRNGESSTLRLQPKGVYRSLGEAQRVAEDLISSKRAEGYQRGTDSNNPNLLGTPAPARAGMRPQPDLSARTELDIDDTDSELERIHRNPLGRTNRDMTPITEINGVRINQPVRGVDPDMTMDEETLKESRKKDKKTPDKKIDLNAPSDESLKSLLDELETPEGLDFGV